MLSLALNRRGVSFLPRAVDMAGFRVPLNMVANSEFVFHVDNSATDPDAAAGKTNLLIA